MSQAPQLRSALFKSFMSDVSFAQTFLQKHLNPSFLAICDMTTLHIEDATLLAPDMRQHFTDILYRVKTKSKEDTSYIHALFEHEHFPDKLIAFRVLECQVSAMRRHIDKEDTKYLPLVIPLLIR